MIRNGRKAMRFKAVFFDRDNTLYYNPQKLAWRNETVAAWSGKPLNLPYEKSDALV